MPDQDPKKELESLRPRFSIKKSRILSDPKEEKMDFVPDKVVYIEIDDEITHVFDRIKRLRGKKIALVIPKQAILLQSIVNLKILKKKVSEEGKEMIIVTCDLAGLQFAEKAGLAGVERLFDKKEESVESSINPPSLLNGFRGSRASSERVSISDVIRNQKISPFSGIISRLQERLRKKKKEKNRETRIIFIAPNKQALFTLILVSVLLLLAIAYIALPGATITLTPKSSILDPSFNVTFLDYERNRDAIDSGSFNNIVVASFAVKPPSFTKKFSYAATGKTFNGQNARGVITVYNLSANPWDLAATTRFQTSTGLIFRTPVAVRVPASRGANPGKLDIAVRADEFDVNGQVIGTRGNIPSTRFFLPGIKNEENQKKIYGQNALPMTGGVSQTVKTASKEDIIAAEEKIKREITKGAAQDLKKYLEQQNFVKKTNLSLLADNNVIKISEPVITIPENIANTQTDQFDVTATYTLSGLAYDRQDLVGTLKERLVNRVDPDKKIIKVQEDDISYRFLDQDESIGKVRLTATMRAIQVYDLDPEKENGRRFLKKIADHVLGLRIQDAEEYLQQQTNEVARVDIRIWPIWAPTIPNIADNIKFVIQDEGSL